MMNDSKTDQGNEASLGIFFIGIGLFFYFFSWDIKTALQQENDPGPRALPVFLSGCLLLGGIYLLGQGLLGRWLLKRHNGVSKPLFVNLVSLRKILAHQGSKDALVILLSMAIYIPAMTIVLGFSLGTFLFATWILVYLKSRWWMAMIISSLLVVVIYLLFVKLFSVSLPGGLWEMM